MTKLNFRSAATIALASLAFSAAQATVIDFDDLGTGTIVDDEYASLGLTIAAHTNGSGPEIAVVFDTDNPTGGDIDLEAPFFSTNGDIVEPFSPGNVLVLQESAASCGPNVCDEPDDNGGGGFFLFTWDSPMILNSIDFFDIEASEAGAPITIQLATTNGILPAFTVPETGGDNTWGRLNFEGIRNVIGMQVNLNGSGAIDNLNFEIPLPGVAWLFFSGLGVFAARARRRVTA